MALSPNEVIAARRERYKEGIASVIASIDDALVKAHTLTGGVYIGYGKFSGLPHEVKEDIYNQYRAQGWNVVESHDQRDGSSVMFEPKKPIVEQR